VDESIKSFLTKFVKFPLDYKLVRADQSLAVDFQACKLTDHHTSLIKKQDAPKMQVHDGLDKEENFQEWLNMIGQCGLSHSVTFWFKTYQNAYSSAELISYLEKEGKSSRKQVVSWLNKMLEKRFFYILTGQTHITDDHKQYIQLQKSLVPIGFGKVLHEGDVKKPGKLLTASRHLVLYEEGLAVFHKNRLLEALVFVPTMKYIITSRCEQGSFALSIPPYCTLKVNTQDKEWVEQFKKLDKYFDVRKEEFKGTGNSFRNLSGSCK